ncbi:MAG: universal stress protein [Acidobacteriota bacterium]
MIPLLSDFNGSRGLTGIKKLLLGSVAQSIVSHAPCSVEVVRAAGQSSCLKFQTTCTLESLFASTRFDGGLRLSLSLSSPRWYNRLEQSSSTFDSCRGSSNHGGHNEDQVDTTPVNSRHNDQPSYRL